MLWDPLKGRQDEVESTPARASRAWGGSTRPATDDGVVYPTKAFRKFLNALSASDAPVLMDLGPVVGSNVSFLGERLGCKLIVEDLFGLLDRRREAEIPLAEVLGGRLTRQPNSVDGILCWNIFDYLDPRSAQVVAATLTKMLRPEGALLAFFTTVAGADTRYSKYVILDEDSVKQRPYSAGGKPQRALQNRDIIRMFDGLKVAESFLLKTNVREFLFRKPAAPPPS